MNSCDIAYFNRHRSVLRQRKYNRRARQSRFGRAEEVPRHARNSSYKIRPDPTRKHGKRIFWWIKKALNCNVWSCHITGVSSFVSSLDNDLETSSLLQLARSCNTLYFYVMFFWHLWNNFLSLMVTFTLTSIRLLVAGSWFSSTTSAYGELKYTLNIVDDMV